MGFIIKFFVEFFKRLFRLTPETMSDERLKRAYEKAGAIFGDAVSYIYMGECIGFADLLTEWESYEAEWAKRGFQTHSLDAFIALGGYNRPLENLGAKRASDEKIVLHAAIYREVYLGKMPSGVLEEVLQGKSVVRSYVVPSTEEGPDGEGPYRE